MNTIYLELAVTGAVNLIFWIVHPYVMIVSIESFRRSLMNVKIRVLTQLPNKDTKNKTNGSFKLLLENTKSLISLST